VSSVTCHGTAGRGSNLHPEIATKKIGQGDVIVE